MRVHCRGREAGDLLAGEAHRAALDRAAGAQDAEGGAAGQRLAAARLADEADRLAAPDGQRGAEHGARAASRAR